MHAGIIAIPTVPLLAPLRAAGESYHGVSVQVALLKSTALYIYIRNENAIFQVFLCIFLDFLLKVTGQPTYKRIIFVLQLQQNSEDFT